MLRVLPRSHIPKEISEVAKVIRTCCAIVIAAISVSAYAQLWPIPDYTKPGVGKPCAQCPVPNADLPTPGWSDPVQRYVGRFMSSEYVADWQQPFRTVRADGIRFDPSGTRIYEKFGQAIAVYDAAGFLSRVDAHEALVPISALPAHPTAGSRFGDPLELFLQVDRYFYAEDNGAHWITPLIDGQERLYDWDIDDRGYVYIAYSIFGWGVARDDGPAPTLLPSWQDPSSVDWAPNRITWVRDGSSYYALVGRSLMNSSHVFLVPDAPATPREQAAFPKGIVKAARAGANRVAIVDQATSSLFIYDTHSLVTNGQPLANFLPAGNASRFTDVIWDGTRFWACSYSGSVVGTLSTFTPDSTGQSYTRADFTLSNGQLFQPLNMGANSGYLAMAADDSNGSGVHLYKIATGTPVEIPVPSINKYYQPPAGYARPPHTQIFSAVPYVKGGNLYLIVSANGLGDIYQIRSDDAITVTRLPGTVGGTNSNAPARTPGDVFYGDTLQFQATASSGATGTSINWDFGDGQTNNNGTIGATVNHQFVGLTAQQVAAGVTVKATNPSTAVVGTTHVDFDTPQVRFGIGNSSAGPKYLFAQPNASSPAPIVIGDSFFDASNGDSSGHTTEWRIGDNVAAITSPTLQSLYLSPTSPVSVGGCGDHAMTLTAHYGSLIANDHGQPVSLPAVNGSTAFGYTVRAFSPVIDGAVDAASGKIKFVSTSRAATPIAGNAVTYTWEVVEQNGATVQDAGAPVINGPVASDPSPMTIDKIPPYLVTPSVFSTSGRKARLTITMDDGAVCSGVTTTPAPATGSTVTNSSLSAALVPPDAQLSGSCSGNNCQFTISSATNVMTSDAWTMAWSATGATPSIGTGSTFNPVFAKAGTYTVSVVVTNKMGLSTSPALTKTVTIAQDLPLCPTMVANSAAENVWITVSGNSCTGSTCDVTFTVVFWQYQPTCATHTYHWTFDNNATADGISVTRSLGSGAHTVTCVVSNGGQSLTLQANTTVTATPNSPPPPPPPVDTSCAPLVANSNVFMAYSGPTSHCKDSNTNCVTGEQISFSVSFWGGYNESCATHTYSWQFDDGGTASGQYVNHSFATAGQHTATCTVNNGKQSVPVSSTILVAAASTPPPPTCGTLTNANTFLTYSGPTSGCRDTAGVSCNSGEPLNFVISYWGFNPTCTTTYSWQFDDGGTGSGQSVTHAFTQGGQHTATCTITYGTQTLPLTTTVNVGGNPATPAPVVTVAVDYVGPYAYRFTPTVVSGTVTKFIWDFGDGSGSTAPDPRAVVWTYAKPGTYTVTLMVQSAGPSTVVTTTVEVTGSSRSRAVRY